MVENTGGEISFLRCNRHVQCILNTVQEHLCTILIRRFLWRQKLLCAGVLFTQHVTDLINECRAELSQRLNAMELLGDQSASQSLLFKHLRMQLPPPLRSRPPLLRLRCLGERFSPPSGSGRSPAAKRYLVNFRLKILPLVATIFRNLGGSALIINALPLSFCKNAPPTFSMVHLLHRLYGVDATVFKHLRMQLRLQLNKVNCLPIKGWFDIRDISQHETAAFLQSVSNVPATDWCLRRVLGWLTAELRLCRPDHDELLM